MALVNVSTATETSDTGSLTLTNGLSVTAGNFVAIWLTFSTIAERTVTVSGGGIGTWTRDAAASRYQAGPDNWQTEVFYVVATATTTTNPTLTFSTGGNAGYAGAFLMQFDSYSSYIGGVTNRQTNPGTGTGAITTGNVNITSQPARQIGVFFNFNATTPPTVVSGFTDHGSLFGGYVRLASRTVTATGNSAATATAGSGQGGATYYSSQIAFAESGGGGSASILRQMMMQH